MNNKGFAVIAIFLSAVIILALGGGIWYYEMHNSAPPSQATSSTSLTTAQANQAAVTIDPTSLTSDSENPTITGTAQNMDAVVVNVAQPQKGSGGAPGWADQVDVKNGHWSYTPSLLTNRIGEQGTLSPGSYIVSITSTSSPDVVIASGTLVVETPAIAPIKISSPTPGEHFVLQSWQENKAIRVITWVSPPNVTLIWIYLDASGSSGETKYLVSDPDGVPNTGSYSWGGNAVTQQDVGPGVAIGSLVSSGSYTLEIDGDNTESQLIAKGTVPINILSK